MSAQLQITGNASAKTFNLSRKALADLMHVHSHIKTLDDASHFRTGVLDVELLRKAQLNVAPEIESQPVVAIEAAAMTFNFMTHRQDPVFLVRSADGSIQGHYFGSAFKSLGH